MSNAIADQLRMQALSLLAMADQLDGGITSTPTLQLARSELEAIFGKPLTTPGGVGGTTYRFEGDAGNVTAADVDRWERAGKPAKDADGNELSNTGVPIKLYQGGRFTSSGAVSNG